MRTRTSRAGNDEGAGTAGFTLVEVLAALVIVALVAGMVTVGFSRRTDRLGLVATAAQIAGGAREARSNAIRHGREAMVLVDLESRTVVAAGARRPVRIPPDIDIDVTVATAERRGRGGAVIRFFPDGASTGGTIRLAGNGVSYEVRVNWFTGNVRIEPPL